MKELAINCKHVSKKYRDKYALNDLNMSIPSGKIVGILGPNGSGKSTLFKSLVNLVQPDHGKITVLNREPSWQLNKDIAYLSDRAGWFPEQTVRDAMEWASSFLSGFDRSKANELVTMMKIEEDVPAKEMSKGQEARLKLLMCIARTVPLVILDEPFSGLDVVSKDFIINGLIEYISNNKKQTVIISTHEIEQVEALFDYVVFLDQGHVRMAGEAEQLRSEHGSMETLFRTLYA